MSLTLGTGPLAQPPLGHVNADLWAVAPERAHPRDPFHRVDARRSATTSRCPYKGLATYEHIVGGGARVDDVGWGYREPLPEALAVAGYRCFGGEGVEVLVDGEPT
jgi:uncharacterized protein (DUF427 family)